MFAEFAPQQSFLGMLLTALGTYAVLIPLAAVASSVLILILILRGREPFAGFAVLLIAPLPLVVGMIGAIHSGISTTAALANSSNPSPNGIWQALMIALFFPAFGLLMLIPGYSLAVLGSVVRTMSGAGTNRVRASRIQDR